MDRYKTLDHSADRPSQIQHVGCESKLSQTGNETIQHLLGQLFGQSESIGIRIVGKYQAAAIGVGGTYREILSATE